MSEPINNNEIVFNGQVESDETVRVVRGNFSEVVVPNEGGGKTTLRGKIQEIITTMGVTAAVGVKMTLPGGQSEIITSMNSPALTNRDGSDREVPKGAEFAPVYQGRAAKQ